MSNSSKGEIETSKSPPPETAPFPGRDHRSRLQGAIVCPVCGAATVQEKCKVICKSEVCHGRVIYNCAEF